MAPALSRTDLDALEGSVRSSRWYAPAIGEERSSPREPVQVRDARVVVGEERDDAERAEGEEEEGVDHLGDGAGLESGGLAPRDGRPVALEQLDRYAIPEFLNSRHDRVFAGINGHPSMLAFTRYDTVPERADVYGWSGAGADIALSLTGFSTWH